MRQCLRLAVLAALAAVAGAPGCKTDESDASRIKRFRQEGNAEALAKEAENPEARVAASAVEALGYLGSKSMPYVEKALKDSREQVREAAAVAYAGAARDGAGGQEPPLRELAAVALNDSSANVRAAAVSAIGQVKALNEMETLLTAVEDPDRVVRVRALAAITRILNRRYELYIDGTPEQRHAAVEALRQSWPSMKEGVSNYYKIKRGQIKPPAGAPRIDEPRPETPE